MSAAVPADLSTALPTSAQGVPTGVPARLSSADHVSPSAPPSMLPPSAHAVRAVPLHVPALPLGPVCPALPALPAGVQALPAAVPAPGGVLHPQARAVHALRVPLPAMPLSTLRATMSTVWTMRALQAMSPAYQRKLLKGCVAFDLKFWRVCFEMLLLAVLMERKSASSLLDHIAEHSKRNCDVQKGWAAGVVPVRKRGFLRQLFHKMKIKYTRRLFYDSQYYFSFSQVYVNQIKS